MADRLGLGTEERILKIGQSFTNPRSKAFHTLRYDFKPASVDTSKKAQVDVGDNHQVTINVPHLDGAGTTQTVFKGSQRPYTKECVLIIDRTTGEITLEKLSCNIQVKKTRSKVVKAPMAQDRSVPGTSSAASSLAQRAATPPIPNGVGSRVSSKTRVTSGSRRPDRQITQLLPKHSPPRVSPNHPSPAIANQRSPARQRDNFSTNTELVKGGFKRSQAPYRVPVFRTYNPSALASLPMIGMDDFGDPAPPIQPPAGRLAPAPAPAPAPSNNGKNLSPMSDGSDNRNPPVGTISDSSSSSSDSDSDSDAPDNVQIKNGYGTVAPSKANGHDLATLDNDLQLSESGSDSD
ncbi:hypothetical protein HUJ04_001210 [Dendroctonus ponderosae]